MTTRAQIPTVSMALVVGPLTQPLLDEHAAVSGLDVEVHAGTSVDRTSREMLDGRYDVAEMSLATYLKARQQTGESTAGMTFDSVASKIRAQIPQLLQKHQARAVDFKVVIKGGKAILKAVPKT